jgi:hypothetical protein
VEVFPQILFVWMKVPEENQDVLSEEGEIRYFLIEQ